MSMKSAARLAAIFPNADDWQLGIIENGHHTVVPLEGGGDDIAACCLAAAQYCQSHKIDATAIVLALPSRWCLSAEVDATGLPSRGKHQALSYRLEDQMPLDAEHLVADFVQGREQTTALGISTIVSTVRPVVEALEAQGIAVQSICPAALLAAEAAIRNLEPAPEFVVLPHGDAADLVFLKQSRLCGWQHVAKDPAIVALHLRHRLRDLDAPITAVVCGESGSSHPWRSLLTDEPGLASIDSQPVPVDELATQAAGCIVSNNDRPTVELRRDALAPPDSYQRLSRPINALLVAVILLAVSVAGAAWVRVGQYQDHVDAMIAQQQAVYAAAFPGQRPPAALLARMRSEAAKLDGARGGQMSTIPERHNVLGQLHTMLAALPRSLRFRILDVRLSAHEIYIEGQTRTHGDADQIAAQLRSAGFLGEAPRTQNLRDGGVAFSLRLKPEATATDRGISP